MSDTLNLGDSDTVKILLVEDDEDTRNALVEKLQERYTVCHVGQGEAAWEILLLDPSIRLILCDLHMPVMDGYGLLNTIRSSKVKRVAGIPFIVIADANLDDASKLAALEQGANDFVNKHANQFELVTRIHSLLELGKAQRALLESRQALAKNAAYDPVLQIATPHFLDMQLDMQWAFAQRHNSDLALLCLRIDRGPLGEQARNQILFSKVETILGELLGKLVRKEDCVARTGEGEFTLLAAGIDMDAATAFAHRICAGLAKTNMKKLGEDVKLSVSIGIVTTLHDHVHSMYEFRAVARDRVEQAASQGGLIIGDSTSAFTAPVISVNHARISIEQALELIAAGQQNELLPHIDRLRIQLAPLIDFFAELDNGII